VIAYCVLIISITTCAFAIGGRRERVYECVCACVCVCEFMVFKYNGATSVTLIVGPLVAFF